MVRVVRAPIAAGLFLLLFSPQAAAQLTDSPRTTSLPPYTTRYPLAETLKAPRPARDSSLDRSEPIPAKRMTANGARYPLSPDDLPIAPGSISTNAAQDVSIVATTGRYPMAGSAARPATTRLPPPSKVITRPRPSTAVGLIDEIAGDLLPAPNRPVAPDELAFEALRHSVRIKVLSAQPRIEQTRIGEADSDFDWVGFLESRWRDTNAPTGSSLTTGGPPVFHDRNLTTDFGLRRRNRLGGELSLNQQIRRQNTNSQFFDPPRQGTAELRLTYNQPLLRGSGRPIAESAVVQAQIDSDIAVDAFMENLQDHLLEVHQTYWRLYEARGLLVIQRHLYHQARGVSAQLRIREQVDTGKDQLLRAAAIESDRKADLLRAERNVIDAQLQLRTLVNSPLLEQVHVMELLPVFSPPGTHPQTSLDQAFSLAVRGRPLVLQTLREIRGANVRYAVAENELLPQLNFVLDSYLNGLRGNYDTSGAFLDQFSEGNPSYELGFILEVPFGRRQAAARRERASLEVERLKNQFRLTLEQLWLETGQVLLELETAGREVVANQTVVDNTRAELSYMQQRRQWVVDGQSGSLFLIDMLNTQDRLANAQRDLLRSRVSHVDAILRLRRATGELLQATHP